MSDELKSLVLSDCLSAFLARIWPEKVEKMFDPNHLFYHTLLDFSINHGAVPQGDKPPYFVAEFCYDLVSFERTKAIFEISGNITLEMHEAGRAVEAKGMSVVFMRDLRQRASVEALRPVIIPPVKEIDVVRFRGIPGRQFREKVWCFEVEIVPPRK